MIDFQKWGKLIKEPNWYFGVVPDLQTFSSEKNNNSNFIEEKEKIYDFFELHLKEESIFLGETGKNWDKERKPIDSIIIHHTHHANSLSLERLSAIELVRLYATYYANPTYENDKEIKGTPIYSGHFRKGKQVFWPYHWIVRKGGKIEHLLEDHEIGWQSGNWEMNCRSVAICLDNNYENEAPAKEEILAVASIIKKDYPAISPERIFGHREINKNTTCPSNFFLGDNGWKKALLEEIFK